MALTTEDQEIYRLARNIPLKWRVSLVESNKGTKQGAKHLCAYCHDAPTREERERRNIEIGAPMVRWITGQGQLVNRARQRYAESQVFHSKTCLIKWLGDGRLE